MLTRRDVLRRAGTATSLATTASWWLVRRAHAARDKKLVVWVNTALAPQVDKILQDQFYAYVKQAGLKDNEIGDTILGSGQITHNIVASIWTAYPLEIT